MRRILIIAGALVLTIVVGCTRANEKILLIFSYHPTYQWVVEEAMGAELVLKNRGIDIESFYLDTKRKTGAEWKKKVAAEAVKKIDEIKPAVVIVFDDNACELVAKKYIGKDLPFVFCGMNGDPRDYGFFSENMTGVIEREHKKETIDLLRRIVPGVKTVAILTDNSPTSRGFVAELKKTELPVEVRAIVMTDDFAVWKEKLKKFQSEVDAVGLFLYHTIKEEKTGKSQPPEEVLQWTLANNMKPEFAFLGFTVREGALCGVTISGYQQGKAAAEKAVAIIDGQEPAAIPIGCPEKGDPMVNVRRALELGIKIPPAIAEEVQMVR